MGCTVHTCSHIPGATDAATGTQSGLSAALIAGIVTASVVACLLTFFAVFGAGVIAHSLYKKKSTHTSREWLCTCLSPKSVCVVGTQLFVIAVVKTVFALYKDKELIQY